MTVRLPDMPLLFLPLRGNESGRRAVRALRAGRSLRMLSRSSCCWRVSCRGIRVLARGCYHSLQLMLDLRARTLLPVSRRELELERELEARVRDALEVKDGELVALREECAAKDARIAELLAKVASAVA